MYESYDQTPKGLAFCRQGGDKYGYRKDGGYNRQEQTVRPVLCHASYPSCSSLNRFISPGVPEGEQQNRCYPTLEWRVNNHDDWRDFMDCLRRGAPLVVKNSTKAFQRQYDFEYFAHALKGRTIVAIHVLDGQEQEKDAFDFFMSIARGDEEANIWKIKVGRLVFTFLD